MSAADWRKSSFSYVNGDCVEVAGRTGGPVSVRDSKNPSGAVLAFDPVQWHAFVGGVRGEGHDHL
jgi:Domain of unknown function (DUF397)